MNPRINRGQITPRRSTQKPRTYRPSANELISGSKLSRGELSLFVLLATAVGVTLVEHAKIVHRFMQDLPEFTTVIANLLRNVV